MLRQAEAWTPTLHGLEASLLGQPDHRRLAPFRSPFVTGGAQGAGGEDELFLAHVLGEVHRGRAVLAAAAQCGDLAQAVERM